MLSSGSSGMRVEMTGSEAAVTEAVSPSPDSLMSSVVLGFRRLTTRVFFLRICERECLPAPIPSPVVAECMLTREGRDGKSPLPSSDPLLKVYVVLVLPTEECALIRPGVAGVELPADSFLSDGPAQARKTASRIEGVNKERVRCESVKAARRSRFFWENNEWISDPPSRDNEEISLASRTFPLESTASCGGLENGSTATSSFSCFAACATSSSSFARYSGHHNRNESLWIIAGNSSIINVRNCFSISLCR